MSRHNLLTFLSGCRLHTCRQQQGHLFSSYQECQPQPQIPFHSYKSDYCICEVSSLECCIMLPTIKKYKTHTKRGWKTSLCRTPRAFA